MRTLTLNRDQLAIIERALGEELDQMVADNEKTLGTSYAEVPIGWVRYTHSVINKELDLAISGCKDCGRSTFKIHEYYMVHNEVWAAAGMTEGMLCIGCLEKRLKRKLTPADFTDCPLNRGTFRQSRRLQRRLAGF